MLAGCANKVILPKFSEVKGTVSLPDGSPLPVGRLELHIVQGQDTEPFGDIVDGKFTIIGAIPGKYKVQIALMDYRDPSGSPVPIENPAVNPRYTKKADTPLEIEIKEGLNDFNLKLEN